MTQRSDVWQSVLLGGENSQTSLAVVAGDMDNLLLVLHSGWQLLVFHQHQLFDYQQQQCPGYFLFPKRVS